MKQRERVQRTASTKHTVPKPASASGASRGGPLAAQRVAALQSAAGNRAAQTAVQRNYGMRPEMAAKLGNKQREDAQAAQLAKAEREAAAKKKKADEFNAARSTIESDPRYQQMQADASSAKVKFIDLVSSTLKGAMGQAWEEGDKAGQYEGDSADSFAGPSAGLDAYMQGNDEAYNMAVEMGGSHRKKQSEQEGKMAIDMAGKIIPGGGGMIASAAKTGAQALAGQAVKEKQATETIKVNKVLMAYLLGTPAKAPEGPLQEKFEAARLTVAARYGSHLAEFAEIEEVDSDTLPDFKFAMEETQSEVDSETDWDAIPTRGRR